MRKEWLITFRSVTFAQRAERVLQHEYIFCQLQRTPKLLTVRGCGYCLRLPEKDVQSAVEILRREQIPYGKVYALKDGGIPEEQVL